MKSVLKVVSAVSVLSATAIASTMLMANPAAAQTANGVNGMNGSYLGAGIAAGVTDGGQGDDDAAFGANIQGRYAIPNAPVSVRGAALIGGDSAALMPMVTFDAPIARNTNLYAGAGYSFVLDEGKRTPLGNQDAVVLTAGIESAVARNVVVYGDAKLGIDAYRNANTSAVSLQLGAAYRF